MSKLNDYIERQDKKVYSGYGDYNERHGDMMPPKNINNLIDDLMKEIKASEGILLTALDFEKLNKLIAQVTALQKAKLKK